MTLAHVTTHVTDGQALLLSQFQQQPRMLALLGVYLGQVQQIEDQLFNVYALRMINNPATSAAQLDMIGRVVGQKRNGATDAQYIVYLGARIRVNFSTGKLEDIIKVAAELLPGNPLLVRETYPKSVEIEPTQPVTTQSPLSVWKDFLNRAKPAGTELNFIYTVAATSATLTFGSVSGDAVTSGQYLGSVSSSPGAVFADAFGGIQMARPPTLPSWATTATYPATGNAWDGQPTRVAPPAGTQSNGFSGNTKLPAEYANWLHGLEFDWIAYLDSERAAGVFSDGSDGTVTLDGTVTVAWATKVGNVYTLTRDIFPANLTINTGVTLVTAGFIWTISGSLAGTGAIDNSGGNGGNNVGNAGGAAGAAGAAGTLAGGAAGNGGATVPNGSNIAGSPGNATSHSLGGSGGSGGQGGGSSAGGTATAPAATDGSWHSVTALTRGTLISANGVFGIAGGASGGAGGGNANNGAVGGGGSGGGGGVIVGCAKTYAFSGTLSAKGGNGGNGGGGGASTGFVSTAYGGGGGGGGTILVTYAVKTGTPTYVVTGGAGGTGLSNGAVTGSGAAGAAGNSYEFPL